MEAATDSNDIALSLKSTLVDEDGVDYRRFRSGLEPRWRRVWLDLAAAYTILAAVPAAIVLSDPGGAWAALAAFIGAAAIGYVIHFLSNFFHEATHYNIAPGRRANDLLANLLMSWLFASSIGAYRKIHFQHHRALGTTDDSETSYFDALRIRFLVEGLLGVKAARTALRRDRIAREKEAPGEEGEPSRLAWVGLAAGVNLAIAAGLVAIGSIAAATAWAGGLLLVFPFLASLRQLLEHRSEEADPEADYRLTPHGAVNRLFGDGPLASTLGSAGFNRHAIHHWEPTVSYTRLRDIEDYLLRSEAAPLVVERQTSYGRVFLRLLEL